MAQWAVPNKKRRQHHVWQSYLKSWVINDRLYCLRNGRIFPTGTTVVAVERDFYKLYNLTQEDIALVRMLAIDGANPYAKKLHQEFLGKLILATRAAEQIRSRKGSRQQLVAMADATMTNTLEDYYAGIEGLFRPLLDRVIAHDIGFYSDDKESILFLHFLSIQYMRTRGIKVGVIEINKEKLGLDLTRIWNLLSYMYAVNIGASLYVERKNRNLYLVRNRTDVPFITGDQPVINLHGTRPVAPTTLSLYYPISPTLGLFLTEEREEPIYSTESLTSAQASELNAKIANASHSQLFGHSKTSLLAVRELASQ
jgi:hypothetical protein